MKGFLWCPHCGLPHELTTRSCPKNGKELAVGLRRSDRGLAVGELIAKRYQVRAAGTEESIALVYEANQLTTGRRVLVKVVNDDSIPLDEREAEIREMQREAYAAAMVEHPNVSTVIDFRKLGTGEAFLVRERTSRLPLSYALRAAGVLGVADAGDLIAQLLSGLHAIHEVGIVHRDLGTHHIMMVKRAGCGPILRIGGLGRCSAPKLGLPHDSPSGIHYASPELLSGDDVDHRSDLFACGVILFEMLTGRRPFEAATADRVEAAILLDPPPAASKLASRLTPEWLDVLDRALQKRPEDRYQTALDFLTALPSHAPATGRLRAFAAEGDATETGVPGISPASEPPRSRADRQVGSRCDSFIGRRLGNRYDLESLLGSGSAGAVYRANHRGLRRPVAVKVLHDRNRTSVQTVERFKAEALLASKLDHPNITRVLDCGEEPDGTLYLVMEYLDGTSLDAVIAESGGSLSPERSLDIAIQVLSSLVVAHAAGVIHRDVKPENIIVIRSGDDEDRSFDLAKVCDFGIAKLFHRDEGSPELTTVGLVLGSPVYMAPEQISAEPCDERTDVYAVGVTLFEMLTGCMPHDADTMTELFRRKLTEPPRRPSTFVPDIDPLLEDIVMHALERDPALRHASAAELRSELVEALGQLRPAPPSDKSVTIWPEPLS